MTNTARTNAWDFETRVYNVRDLRYTPNGDAVCNARINLSTKLDDEWHSVWYDLAAWDDAAEVLARCEHGDDIIIYGGRVGANAYKDKHGQVQVEPRVNTNKLERVGSFDAGQPQRTPPPADEDVPF